MRRRPTLFATLACAALAAAAPARAADATVVASSAEPGNPLDVQLSVRYERDRKQVTLTRERADPQRNRVVDQDALHYEEASDAIIPRLAIGVWKDLELHLEIPYVLSDDHSWRHGVDDAGRSLAPLGRVNEGVDRAGNPLPEPAPVFAVPETVYHGGKLGDLKAGLAWNVLRERGRDPASWLVGVDVTFPTADRYDPTTGQTSTSDSKVSFGRKVWGIDLRSGFSRRTGIFDPYVLGHVLLQLRSRQTYSNCEHPALLANGGNCGTPAWDDEADADPPWIAGASLGTEVVPLDRPSSGKRLAIDLRLSADHVSRARWLNELTDATGKLLATEEFLRARALAAVHWRFSHHFETRAEGWFEHETPHFLTGEPLGRSSGTSALPPPADRNPNYDFRWDPVGRRFRTADAAAFGLALALALRF